MATDDKNLKGVYETLKREGYEPPVYEEFVRDMSDDKNLRGVHETLKKSGYTPPEFSVFKADMFGSEVKSEVRGQRDVSGASARGQETKEVKVTSDEEVATGGDRTGSQTGQESQWRMSEGDKVRMSMALDKGKSEFRGQMDEAVAKTKRLAEGMTPEGREREKAARMMARANGVSPDVMPIFGSGSDWESGQTGQTSQTVQGRPRLYDVRKDADGKVVRRWLLPDGSLTESAYEAGVSEGAYQGKRLDDDRRWKEFVGYMESMGLDPDNKEHRKVALSGDERNILEYRLKEAEKRLKDTEDRLNVRSKTLMEEHEKNKPNAFLRGLRAMADAIHGDRMGGNEGTTPEDYIEFVEDSQYQALKLASSQQRDEITRLRNALSNKVNNDGFFTNFFRSGAQELFKSENWDFGKSALRNARTMLDISRRVERGGKLSEAEQDALYETYLNQRVMSDYGDLGAGDRWGGIAGSSVSFMKDFLLTGGFSGVGTKIPSEAAKRVALGFAKKRLASTAGTKLSAKIGEEGLKKAVLSGGKGTMKEALKAQGKLGLAATVTTRALGVGAEDLLVRAPLMTATVQGQNAAADVIKTKLGDVAYNPETNELRFVNDKSWGSAAWESTADRVIENFSEMWGGRVLGVSDLTRAFGARKLTGAILRATRENAGTLISKTNNFLAKAGVNGYFGEVGEEYFGQLWRTGLNLESATDEEGNNLFMSSKFHGDIWGGMALSIGLTGGAAYATNGVSKLVDYGRVKGDVVKASSKASQILGKDVWEPMRGVIDTIGNDEVGEFAETVLKDEKMSESERKAVMDYLEASMVYRGFNLGELLNKRITETEKSAVSEESDEESPDGDKRDEIFDEALSLYDSGHDVYKRFEEGDPSVSTEVDGIVERVKEAEEAFEDAFGAESEYYRFRLNENPWGLVNDPELTVEQQDAVLYYINAKAALDGVMDASTEAADRKRAEVERSVKQRSHKDKDGKEDGTIISAETKMGKQVYIVMGDVVMFPDGSGVDRTGSSGMIWVFNPESGEVEPSAPEFIERMTGTVSAEEEMRTAFEAIEQEQGAFEAVLGQSDEEISGESEEKSVSLSENLTNDGNGSEQDNDERTVARQDDGGRVASDPAGGVEGDRDRSDIRVYEEGLASSRNEHSEYSERDRREAESERLVGIAKDNNGFISRNDIFSRGDKHPKGTGESEVVVNKAEGKVYKIKNPYAKSPMKGNVQPEDAIYEHLVHNKYFPETRYSFEGISEDLGEVRIVLSQNYVESVGQPTKEQIEAALAEKGLYPEGQYRYGNDEVSVTDVTGDNALLGADGKVYFIDPVIDFKKSVREILGEVISQGDEVQGETALSRIPTNEKGEPMFEAAPDKETAWDGLVEAVGSDKDAADIAQAQIEQASTELEALKKKPPTLKEPKLKGSPMAMARAKKDAQAKYDSELADYNQRVAETEAKVESWRGIVGVYEARKRAMLETKEAERRQRDAELHDEAGRQHEADMRLKAEREAEQAAVGTHAVNPKIKEKWDSAEKINGNKDVLTLPDGSTIGGRYVLMEAGVASASHNPFDGYRQTEGFPVDENGQSVNDRDYERDKEAQRIVEQIADGYDSRALQSPVIVSRDGIVLSGNNRTMSGDLAARQGTDQAYIDYLRDYGSKYGFTVDQVDRLSHPRVVFVAEGELPYTAETFARFNAQEMKSQSKAESAVKMGKVVPDNVFDGIVRDISKYDRLSDFYGDEQAVADALGALVQSGVINDKQLPEMRTGRQISASGKELIENVLIGKAFEGNGDAVRQVLEIPSLRQSVVMGLSEVASNRRLQEAGYDLGEELASAIDLVWRAKTSEPEIYKDGMAVSPYGRENGLFDELYGDSRVTDGATLLLADILNSGRPGDLRKVLAMYNREASDSASGMMDLTTGEVSSKEDILKKVNELFDNADRKERQRLVESAIAERKRRAEQETDRGGSPAEQVENVGQRGGEGSERGVATGASRGLGGEAPGDLQKSEEVTCKLSEEVNEFGKPFVISSDGTTDFGVIEKESGLAPLPIKLSLGENYKDEDGKDRGYGYLHIDAGHRDEILQNGFSSIEEFVETVARNYTDIKEGSKIGESQTYLLEVSDEHNNTLFIQLSRDGKYWNVNSAGIFRKRYSRNKIKVYAVPAVEGRTGTDTPEVDSGQNEGATAPAGNSPKTSGDKGSKSLSNKQEAESESLFEGEVNLSPTPAQKEAGNYKKGHVTVEGMRISIENPKGSNRSGVDADGNAWETRMTMDYGYIRGTQGKDKDHIDIYLGENPTGDKVFVVDQYNKDGSFDEHKVVYGVGDAIQARMAYLENYSPGWAEGRKIEVTEVSMADFKKWAMDGKRKVKPFAEYKAVKALTPEKTLTEEEATSLISRMESMAEVAPSLDLTPENWLEQFGEEGKVDTPVGVVKMGENQFMKLFSRKRAEYFGMIKPTLTNPDVIFEKNAPADNAERNTKYLFVKTFIKHDGSRIVHFESITVQRDGMEVSVSSHEAEAKDIKKDMQKGKILHISEKLSPSSEWSLTGTPKESEGPDLVPTSDNVISDGKVNTFSANSQILKEQSDPRVDESANSQILKEQSDQKSREAVATAKGTKPKEGVFKVTEEMKEQEDELRRLLGIDEVLGQSDDVIMEPRELTAAEMRKIYSVGVNYAFNFLDSGVVTFPEFSKAIVSRLGDKVRPFIKSWYEGAKRVPGYGELEFTPTADVDRFDIEHFDKKTYNPIRDAAARSAEHFIKVRSQSDEVDGGDLVTDNSDLEPNVSQSDELIEEFCDRYNSYLEKTEGLSDEESVVSDEEMGREIDRYRDLLCESLMSDGMDPFDARQVSKELIARSMGDIMVRRNQVIGQSDEEEVLSQRDEVRGQRYETAPGESVEFLSYGELPELKPGEVCHVERRFRKTGEFDFTGTERIESAADVAYVFRELESYSTEHSFAVLVKDGKSVIMHLGMGNEVGVNVSFTAIRAAFDALGGADKVYFVHNHPSGSMKPSPQDMAVVEKLKAMLPKGVAEDGIIIDTLSGEYAVFGENGERDVHKRSAEGGSVSFPVFRFNQTVFSKDYNPSEDFIIMSEEDVAKIVSTQRLGQRDKRNILVLNNRNVVVGSFVLNPSTDIAKMAEESVGLAVRFGGRGLIFFGNQKIGEQSWRELLTGVQRLSGGEIKVLDNIEIENGLNSEPPILEKKETEEIEEEKKGEQPEQKPLELISDKNGGIEDFGEKLEGARKDILKELSRNLDDSTEEAFVKLPLSEAFKRPNSKYLVESGAMTVDEARIVDAISIALLSDAKPIVGRSRASKRAGSFKAKREEKEMSDWASRQRERVEFLKDYIKGDASLRQTFKAGLEKKLSPKESEILEDQFGVKVETIDPMAIAYYVLSGTDYQIGQKVTPIKMSAYKRGSYWYLRTGKTESVNIGVSKDEALSFIKATFMLKNGMDGVQIPVKLFNTKVTKWKLEPTGGYTLSYLTKKGEYVQKEFGSKDEADVFAERFSSPNDYRIKETVKAAGPEEVVIRVMDPIKNEYLTLEGKYQSQEEALAMIDSEYEAINEEAVRVIRANNKIKRQPRSMFEVKHFVATDKRPETWAVCLNGSSYGEMISEHATEKEAKAEMSRLEARHAELVKARREHVYYNTSVERKGKDYRKGQDVTDRMFTEAFGFRGVQFGNWTNQKDRQAALNQAYDGLMDLSAMTGLPSRALSLNGELGLAFGARGGGSAMAHYEPDTIVINLTKTKGEGSLAHEWWHALDHYFARHGGLKYGYATETRIDGIRNEVGRVFEGLREAVSKSHYSLRSRERGDYWGRMRELTARLFTEWVTEKAEAMGERSPFLARGVNPDAVEKYKELNWMLYQLRSSINRYGRSKPTMTREEFMSKPEALKGFVEVTPEELAELGQHLDRLFEVLKTKEMDGNIMIFEPGEEYAGQASEIGRKYVGSENDGRGIFAEVEDAVMRRKTGWDDTIMVSRKRSRIEKLRSSKPIEISGEEIEYSPELKTYKRNAFEFGKTLQGEYVNEDTGKTIQLQRGRRNGGLKEVLQHDLSEKEQIQSVAAIPEIICKSIYIETEPNRDLEKNPDVRGYEHYVCGLKIGGEDYTVHSIVAEDKQGNRYYDHKLSHIEKGRLLDFIEAKQPMERILTPMSGTEPTIRSQRKVKELISLLQVEDEVAIKRFRDPGMGLEETNGDGIKYRLVEEGEELDWLESLGEDELVHVYRNVQILPDGSMASPMAAYNVETGEIRRLTPGRWNGPEERQIILTPEQEEKLATLKRDGEIEGKNFFQISKEMRFYMTKKDGVKLQFNLTRDGSKDMWADYNPYDHAIKVMLNDQFKAAWKRPNLVVVEAVMPKSEIEGAYKAPYAALPTGEHKWNNGRSLYLSRWSKIVRIVPFAEVAADIDRYWRENPSAYKGAKVRDYDRFQPQVREELERLGYRFEDKGNHGSLSDAEREKAYKSENAIYITNEDIERMNAEMTQDWRETPGLERESISEQMREAYRYKAIVALEPIEVERNELSREELFRTHRGLRAVNKNGVEIRFLRGMFGKNYKPKGLFAQAVPFLDDILEDSILAYSEADNLAGKGRPDGRVHKGHPNIGSFDNYIGKIKIDNKEYYVRLTVQNTLDNTSGVHSCFVSNVDLYEKTVSEGTDTTIFDRPNQDQNGETTANSLSYPGSPRARVTSDGIVDAKLAKFFERASVEAEKLDMRERVEELSEKLNTPIRIIEDLSEIERTEDGRTSRASLQRKRRAKGWWSARNGEVVVVLPNNVNVADVENTVVHEVVGHKGLRAFIGEERFDEFLDEVFSHASEPIRKRIEQMTDRMVSEEADRLREQKRKAHERAGEDWNATYYSDMAASRVEAEKRREEFRREATEEYMADLGGRIGDEGFEKMSRDELTLWGKIKAKVQGFLDKFLRGLKISSYSVGRLKGAKSIRLNDKDLSYILYKSWKNLRKKSVFDEAEDVVRRRKSGYDDSMLSEWAKIEDANSRFNKDLEHLTEETASGVQLSLGHPSIALRSAGIENKPMKLYGNKVIKKMKKHGFSVSDLRNLPQAVAQPIAVFKGSVPSSFSVLTELRIGENNVLVSISVGKGNDVDFNIISSTYGKKFGGVLNWIKSDKMLYVDKEKALDYLRISAPIAEAQSIQGQTTGESRLSSASSNYQQEIATQDLDSAAKVIKNFKNPTFEGDDEVRFRDGADYVERVPVMARAMYEKRLQTSMYQFTEAMQDSMRGLMEFYRAVESQGAKRDIEDVASFENAYIAENLMRSKSHAEMEEYEHGIMRPLLDIAARMSGDKRGRQELINYMMAKHGLERNAYMRNEAMANGEETERDFAGLCGLTGERDWQGAELAAQQIVDDYEAAHTADIAEFWSAVNKATKTSLQKIYNSGLLSKEQYEKISDMYDYYIPLRGFDKKTSDDVYGYLTSKGGAFSSPLKKAEGRKSKADDPLATIAYMAQNSIIQGNRNVMKQKFLTYVQNHPSDLASVNRLWLVHDETADVWKPVFADVDENMTPSEIDKAVMDFEERMETLAQSEPDKYKRGSDAIGIPYRLVDGNLKEHQVLVKRNGESFVVTINGNPRAAQAVNGLTNPDNDLNGAIGKVFNVAGTVNRQLSQFYTTRNPDFVVSNFIRDLIYSNTMVHVKEKQGYAMKFHKNHAKVNPIRMVRLLRLYDNNRLNMSNPIHRMFYEFMHWGGETGYTMQRDLEKEKKLVSQLMKEARRGKLNPMSILNLITSKLDQVNRGVENSARFAAFVTSRESGRDVQRSVYDAKEISVNFNKKGSGSKFMDAQGQTMTGKTAGFVSGLGRSFYVFWNAAVQGTTNYSRTFKKHPGKAILTTTAIILLGYVMAALLDDDDDENKNGYYNVPKYTRRSNLMFRFGEQWITIPLPVEYRALYGLGELAYSVTSGREEYSDAELAKETASQLSQLLPLDFMEGGGGLHAFIPSAFKPLVEASTNTSWTGLPIYKDTPFNKDMPEWTKAYPRTSTHLVDISKWANEASGGNDYKAGWANINPAQLEYLLNGYFGGYSNVINKMVKTGETLLGEREYDPSSILLVNRLVKMGDERTADKKMNSDFFKYLEEYKRTHTLLRKYEYEAEQGSDKYRIFLDALKHSRDGARHDVMDEYISDYNWLNRAIKDPEYSEDERESLETDMRRLKREVVSLMKVVHDSVKVNRLREKFAQQYESEAQ